MSQSEAGTTSFVVVHVADGELVATNLTAKSEKIRVQRLFRLTKNVIDTILL
jgi:hypothetical protein